MVSETKCDKCGESINTSDSWKGNIDIELPEYYNATIGMDTYDFCTKKCMFQFMSDLEDQEDMEKINE